MFLSIQVQFTDPHPNKRLKPANIRTNQGNAKDLAQLKQIINAGLRI